MAVTAGSCAAGAKVTRPNRPIQRQLCKLGTQRLLTMMACDHDPGPAQCLKTQWPWMGSPACWHCRLSNSQTCKMCHCGQVSLTTPRNPSTASLFPSARAASKLKICRRAPAAKKNFVQWALGLPQPLCPTWPGPRHHLHSPMV